MANPNPAKDRSASAAIDIRGVVKSYGSNLALDDCSFTLDRGRILGLLGPNGAGKTTLIRIILGLTQPDAGEVSVLGSPVGELPSAHQRIGASMDDIGPLPGATGRAELKIWARRLGIPTERANEVADLVGLSSRDLSRKVKKYSTGMRKRHSLAIAILQKPDLLVLDEPASGLDPEGVIWLRQLLQEFRDGGGTVILSSHTLSEVERVADDVVVLRSSIRYSGTLDDLVADDAVDLETQYMNLVSSQG